MVKGVRRQKSQSESWLDEEERDSPSGEPFVQSGVAEGESQPKHGHRDDPQVLRPRDNGLCGEVRKSRLKGVKKAPQAHRQKHEEEIFPPGNVPPLSRT